MPLVTSCCIWRHSGTSHHHLQMIFQGRHEFKSLEKSQAASIQVGWGEKDQSVNEMKGKKETKRGDVAGGWSSLENKKLHKDFSVGTWRRYGIFMSHPGHFPHGLNSVWIMLRWSWRSWTTVVKIITVLKTLKKFCNKQSKTTTSESFCLLPISVSYEFQATLW